MLTLDAVEVELEASSELLIRHPLQLLEEFVKVVLDTLMPPHFCPDGT